MIPGYLKLVLYKRYFLILPQNGAVIKGYYLIMKNLQKTIGKRRIIFGNISPHANHFPTRFFRKNRTTDVSCRAGLYSVHMKRRGLNSTFAQTHANCWTAGMFSEMPKSRHITHSSRSSASSSKYRPQDQNGRSPDSFRKPLKEPKDYADIS